MPKRKQRNFTPKQSVDSIIANPECLEVCVFGQLKGINESVFTNTLSQRSGFEFAKIKKLPQYNWAHISFASQDQKSKSLPLIADVEFKGKTISFSEKSNKQITSEDSPKRRKLNESDEPKDIRDVTTPLWRLPYEEQLQQKALKIRNTLQQITALTSKHSSNPPPNWIRALKGTRSPCCEYDNTVIPSPVLTRYRNKVSYTIGYDVNDQPTVGFTLGAVRDRIFRVADPSECVHVSTRALEIRSVFENHIRSSEFKPYSKLENTGFWRELTVRDFTTGDGIVIIQVNPTELSTEQLNQEKQKLKQLCIDNNIKESLFLQCWAGKSNAADPSCPLEHLSDDSKLYSNEKLFDLTFQVSPTAFFQVNTKGAEVLYKLIADWCNLNQNSTVLDICCGTGSISLSIARSVKKVIGVEIVPESIENAKLNATNNRINNVEFLLGKAEEVVPSFLANHSSEEFVAILDPPRAGVHKKVLQAIRNCPGIKRIVFVSCDHTNGLLSNSSLLCRGTSKTAPGEPFKPVKVSAVDMFPHTSNVEVVMLLERDDVTDVNQVVTSEEEVKPKE